MVLRNVFLSDDVWHKIGSKTVSVLHLDHSYYTSAGESLLVDCERVLKDNGVIVIADVEHNALLVGEAYARWGSPRRISTLIKDTVFTALLFSPQNALTLSRFPVWGLDWLEERESVLPTKVGSAFISSSIAQAEEFGLKLNGFDPRTSTFKAKRFTSVLPQFVYYPLKDFRREVKSLERLTKPEGIDDIHGLFPLRLARFLVGAFAGVTGMVIDAGACGVFGHAVLGSKNDCFVFGTHSEFAIDRLESLTLGSWKDWTYHEPVVDGFVFTKNYSESVFSDKDTV